MQRKHTQEMPKREQLWETKKNLIASKGLPQIPNHTVKPIHRSPVKPGVANLHGSEPTSEGPALSSRRFLPKLYQDKYRLVLSQQILLQQSGLSGFWTETKHSQQEVYCNF